MRLSIQQLHNFSAFESDVKFSGVIYASCNMLRTAKHHLSITLNSGPCLNVGCTALNRFCTEITYK